MQNLKETAVEVLNAIWVDIDFESMSNSRKLDFWNEFTGKVKAAANSSVDFERFIERLCKKLNIVAFDAKASVIAQVSNSSEDFKNKLLSLYREQLMIVMLELRLKREDEKESYKARQKAKAAKAQNSAGNDLDNEEFMKITEVN